MERLDVTAGRAVRHLLAGQPTTAAKVAFAWQIAAGPALARASTVAWDGEGILCVHARTDAWRRELVRSQAVLAERIGQLLGPGVVRRIRIAAIE